MTPKILFTESRSDAPDASRGYEPRAPLTSSTSLLRRAFTGSSLRQGALYVEVERHTRSTRSRSTTRRARRTTRSSRNKKSRSVVVQEIGTRLSRQSSRTITGSRSTRARCSRRGSSTAARSRPIEWRSSVKSDLTDRVGREEGKRSSKKYCKISARPWRSTRTSSSAGD